MDKLSTLSERLKDAMSANNTSASDLARACNVSAAAVSKWLDGTTKKLSADNYASASRALGIREEWLRTGRLPRERDRAEEEHEVDRVLGLLAGMREPLTALVAAIDRLGQIKPEAGKKRRKLKEL